MNRRKRITIEIVVLAAAAATAAAVKVAAVAPTGPRTAMTFDGCAVGRQCAPSFYPLPDGAFTFPACASSGCVLFTYTYWSEENCNRLTACPQYRPHRNDVTPAR